MLNNKNIYLTVGLIIASLVGFVIFFHSKKPRTLVVPDNYKSIQSAMDAAKSGDTIFVKAGIYQEPTSISFKNGVRLIGEATELVSIRTEDENARCVIHLKRCKNALIERVTIEFVAKQPYKVGQHGIYLESSSAVINECYIRNMPSSGLYATDSNLSLKKCLIEANKLNGLDFSGEAVIEQCVFSQNEKRGLAFGLGSTGTVLKSLFQNNKDDGITLNMSGPVTIRENTCVANGGNGINCFQIGLEMFKNKKTADTLKKMLEENAKKKQTKERNIIVSDNRCTLNLYNGICLVGRVIGSVENNICQQNGRSGIRVASPSTDVKVLSNHCIQNFENGISFFECTKGLAEKNICERNQRVGIGLFKTEKDVIVKENWCRRNEESGIYFARVNGSVARSNISSSNKQAGIILLTNTFAVAEKNNCYSNHWSGIHVMGDEITVSLKDNECTDNYPSGIFLSHGASGTIENNRCENNPWSGIAIRGVNTKPTLTSNTCKSNGAWGIVTWAGAEPTIEPDNTILGNGCGKIKSHNQIDFGLYGRLFN